jgi:hypothetical protein
MESLDQGQWSFEVYSKGEVIKLTPLLSVYPANTSTRFTLKVAIKWIRLYRAQEDTRYQMSWEEKVKL